MSVQAIQWVLEEAPDVRPHLVSTLIGLANHADRHGRGAHPSQNTLADYTRKSDRSIRNDLAQLKEDGLIREGDQRMVAHIAADERPVVYDLAVERKRPPVKRKDRKPTSGPDAGDGVAAPADGPEAEFRPNDPEEEAGDRNPASGRKQGSARQSTSEGNGSPLPTNRPGTVSTSEDSLRSSSSDVTKRNSRARRSAQSDVEWLCLHLADRIEANGSLRPTVDIGWRMAAKTLLERDGRPYDEALALIDWCQDDDFWKSRVLKMQQFRRNYDQMRLQKSARPANGRASPPPANRHVDPPTPDRLAARDFFAKAVRADDHPEGTP